MSKTPADYLGKPYYPAYAGRFAGEFPHICIMCSIDGIRAIQRIHFSPDKLDEAWEEACAIADRLNNHHTTTHQPPPCTTPT